MKISVIGCGYLGAVHAASMAELGHDVVGIDVDQSKIDALAIGKAPFFEPGLPEILTSAMESGRLRFSTDMAEVAGSAVHFVAVGTPQKAGSNAADMTYVDAAIESLIPYLTDGDLVVGKSTVPVGTAARLAERIDQSGTGAALAWNPEFLREGFAVKDTIAPDRLVYGIARGDAGTEAKRLLDEVYHVALANQTPVVVTDYATAELVKVSANAFLATKISFINAMAEIAEIAGADVTELADAIGFDDRIGRKFLNAGIGFGGGCLPKDIRAFAASAEEIGAGESVKFLDEVDKINLRRRERVINLAIASLDGDVAGKKIAVLGLAFKPNSDDIRDSPALDIAARLEALGANVVGTDPEALTNSMNKYPQLGYTKTTVNALRSADLVILGTEWEEFRNLDPALAFALASGDTIIDGRNTLDGPAWNAAGWNYIGMGRPALVGESAAELEAA